MAYTIEFSLRARDDVERISAHIQEDSPVYATRWRETLRRKLTGLQTWPDACGVAPENGRIDGEIRQWLHGRYRILFTTRESIVFILTIRHGARRFLSDQELNEIE